MFMRISESQEEKSRGGGQIYVNYFCLFLKKYWLAEVNGEIFEYSTSFYTKSEDKNLHERPLLRLKNMSKSTSRVI